VITQPCYLIEVFRIKTKYLTKFFKDNKEPKGLTTSIKIIRDNKTKQNEEGISKTIHSLSENGDRR
jgi:hypothetical protein